MRDFHFGSGPSALSGLRVAVLWLFVSGQPAAADEKAGPVLYNGIQLPQPWPPEPDSLSFDPMPLPYLQVPLACRVIPIDVGRQLFVDDFLIDKTTLHRTFHQPKYSSTTPVLVPDKPWEQTGKNPTAMVFSDGVFFDPKDQLFKMWYMGGYGAVHVLRVTSKDGIHWDKPSLDVVPGTNIVHKEYRDSSTVWLDQNEKDPARRFKMFVVGKKWIIEVRFSPDGIHWGEPVYKTEPLGDRSTIFFNPFRSVWVYGLRSGSKFGRARKYWEGPDALEAAKYKKTDPKYWIGADSVDTLRDDLKTRPELYNLDAAGYESLMLGCFTIWRGQPTDRAKPNEVMIGWSRDGYHWDRSNRTAFLPVSEHHGDWNWCNVQSAGGGCLIVGDELYFYCSGRAGIPGTAQSGVSTTGLAILRRDGFASMDVPGIGQGLVSAGQLVTRPVRFSGKYLFVNVDLGNGELRAEVLDESGKVISPFSSNECVPVLGDHTLQRVTWKSGAGPLQTLG